MNFRAFLPRWVLRLSFFDPPLVRSSLPPAEIARQIDVILYSDLPKEEMLARLAPWVAIGEPRRWFERRTGLRTGADGCIGPYPTDYRVEGGCGLSLVLDYYFYVRIIRRAGRTVAGVEYPTMSISAPFMVDGGYGRYYHT